MHSSNNIFDTKGIEYLVIIAFLLLLIPGFMADATLWDAMADERIAADHELPDTGVGIELERRLSPAFIRGDAYGTRASTLVMLDHEGRGRIVERRFGANGAFAGETSLRNEG